ncbi:MAG: thiamine pyrophosphate-binding protein [Opitutales bacterium]|nr:thiamine pyrophosphate-binding protein [Opitutales bacterium]
MTVAEYLFDFLQKKGLETVFMVSGSSSMWLTDALYRNQRLQAVCCHHEQAAAMAADGYGRLHGIPGCCLVTIGPGATNAITGVAQAFLDSSPMIVISGQANSKLLQYTADTGIRQVGTQSLHLQPIVSSITKYFRVVLDPNATPTLLQEAFQAAISDRPGPVWLDVPIDIQNKTIAEPISFPHPAASSAFPKSSLSEEEEQTILQTLADAQQPLILAGGGIRQANACEELEMLTAQGDIPIVTSRGGIDTIASDNRYFVGRPGAYGDRASHFAIQQCDCLLVLGSRLSVSTVGYYPEQFGKKATKIRIDIDTKELDRKAVPIDHAYCGDLKIILQKLLKKLPKHRSHTKWIEKCQAWKTQYPNVQPSYATEYPLNEYWVTSVLSQLAPAPSNIVVDTGSVCNVVSQSWFLKKGQRYFISGGLSCMGFWATALGTLQKNRSTLAITGDGSMQMNVQELATLAYHSFPVKVFIYHNNGYMLIRHNQHNYMNDRFLGVGPDSGVQTPDFCKVAEAYGIPSVCIEKREELKPSLQKVLEATHPIVCQIKVQEFAPIIPRIASRVQPDGSLKAADFDDLYPFLDKKEA